MALRKVRRERLSHRRERIRGNIHRAVKRYETLAETLRSRKAVYLGSGQVPEQTRRKFHQMAERPPKRLDDRVDNLREMGEAIRLEGKVGVERVEEEAQILREREKSIEEGEKNAGFYMLLGSLGAIGFPVVAIIKIANS